MEKKIFENLLIAVFYIRYSEKRKQLKEQQFPKFFGKIEKEINRLDESLLVQDREESCNLIKEKLLTALKSNEKISDTTFYSLLHEDVDWNTTIGFLEKIIKHDGIVSKQEKEIILKLAHLHHIDVEITKKNLKTQYTRKQKISIWIASLIALLIVAFGIGLWMVNSIEKKKMAAFNIEKYITQNPKLVFKTIKFNKLVVHGKPNGTNEHLDKLNIYHLTGDADLYIDMNCLSMDSAQTDYVQKKLYLVFNSPSKIPISVDVNIPSSNYTLIEEIEPEPISEEEAKVATTSVSIITGGIGALIGGKLGGSIGTTFGKLGKYIGAGIGSASGGVAAGSAGYIATKNFVMGMDLTDNDLEDKENILQTSKALIALEVMGGNVLSEPDYDSRLQKYYQSECERQLKEIMKIFGWQEVYIQFNYKSSL